MKYVFVVNPASGKGNHTERVVEEINTVCARIGADYEVYITKHIGDAVDFVANKLSADDTSELGFIACGGDGTLCEVANGIMKSGHKDRAYLGVIPVGTGNDFTRCFTNKDNFSDVEAQLSSTSMPIDLIKYNDSYAVNMINIGFDCEVVCKKEEIQAKKIFPSKLSYIIGLVMTLIKKPGVTCSITVDGEAIGKKKYLLTTYANGEFCGGGFHSNPNSVINSGLLNSLTVNDLSRTKFVSIVGSYKKGTHLVYTDLLDERDAKTIDIEFGSPVNISVDGEVFKVSSLCLSAEHDAIRFLVPNGCEYKKSADISAVAEV